LVQLGPRDRLVGQLYIEGDVRLGGVIEGEIEATGDVEIDDFAKVKASVAGRDVTIRGQVNGAVVARKRLVVAKSGSLFGDVRVTRLAIQDGATFSGKVSMGNAATESPAKVAPPEPVAIAPEVQAPAVEPREPIVPAPVVQFPAVESRTDGKAKSVPPRPIPPKAPPPKGKQKRR
jgi:cytoskeletal protein CcmA (bactofilin family)